MGLEMTDDRRNRRKIIGEVPVVLYTFTAVAVTASSPCLLTENTHLLKQMNNDRRLHKITDSMEQRPSCEDNRSSVSQEIPRIL
jgi:hypothetical protein